MKRISFFSWSLMLAVLVSGLVVTGCSEDENMAITEPEEVEFTLDYSFAESGSMTRATGSEIYATFYDKYIKTKVLTPKTYSLTFKNKVTNAIATLKGYWGSKDGVRLPEGEYEVTGVSSPQLNRNIPSDTVYIQFNETVNIKKDMENLNLTAIYDSYLLLFDSNNSTKCRFFHDINNSSQIRVDKELSMTENGYYLFIRDFSYTSSTFDPLIYITRLDKQVSTINLDNIPFSKGKYYYFNDMTNSFDIPMMESGN